MNDNESAQRVVLEVIRGDRPWADLQGVGVRVKLTGNECTVDNPMHIEPAVPIHDLAQGLLKHLVDPPRLRRWALIMQALDFETDEDHPAHESLWDALWAASFGDPVSSEARKTAEHLVNEKHKAGC